MMTKTICGLFPFAAQYSHLYSEFHCVVPSLSCTSPNPSSHRVDCSAFTVIGATKTTTRSPVRERFHDTNSSRPTAPTQFSRDSQQFTRLKIPSPLHDHSSFVQMPWIMDDFAASLPDDVRKRIMARLCRLAVREPLEAAEAYLNIRPHKERPGVVYTHLRPNWEVLDNAADIPDDEELDWVDVKVGEAGDLAVRREYYERDCVDEPILWAYYYQTSYPKLIERLTHLTLRAMGAQRVPYPCHGCAVRHREHSSEAKGGLEVVAGIIEYWMRRIGEEPARIPIHLEYFQDVFLLRVIRVKKHG
ncbi:hypothetical protein B0H13DRAFT_1902260 [Mycena leptocephala]|nr:hypothetical protein B0H13DRAFT_1902260 [Mycena leptocephala]